MKIFQIKYMENIVFPQGNYEAFRVIIGEGKGQNWWCVMFPPLCFVDESKNSVDSSSLKDEIENIEPKDSNNKQMKIKKKIMNQVVLIVKLNLNLR